MTEETINQLISSGPWGLFGVLMWFAGREIKRGIQDACSVVREIKPDITLTVKVDGPVHVVNHTPEEDLENERGVIYGYRRIPTSEHQQ